MPSRVVIVQGYGYHLIPERDAPPQSAARFASWEEANAEFVLLSYGKDGKLLLTNSKEPPKLPKGWTYFQPFLNMGAWTAQVNGWKWTLLHQYEDGLSVFAGIVI